MKYHQPTKKFVIEPLAIEQTADCLRYAIKKIREAGGKPLTAYDAAIWDDHDLAQAAIMNIAEALDIDLGHKQFNKLDLTETY